VPYPSLRSFSSTRNRSGKSSSSRAAASRARCSGRLVGSLSRLSHKVKKNLSHLAENEIRGPPQLFDILVFLRSLEQLHPGLRPQLIDQWRQLKGFSSRHLEAEDGGLHFESEADLRQWFQLRVPLASLIGSDGAEVEPGFPRQLFLGEISTLPPLPNDSPDRARRPRHEGIVSQRHASFVLVSAQKSVFLSKTLQKPKHLTLDLTVPNEKKLRICRDWTALLIRAAAGDGFPIVGCRQACLP